MIDHLMAFADEATAKADPVVGAYYRAAVQGALPSPGSWDLSRCIPGLFVWSPASDVTSGSPPVTTHTPYDTLWRINIALPTKSTALAALSSCHLVADRDAANAGQPFVLQSVLTDAQLAALMLQPLFAGSSYPFGHPSP